MEIRIRSTGQVMYESEFRSLHPNTSFPAQLSESLLDSMGVDIVFEGPQATAGTVYQYSMRQGVEQINGKWYTKHVLGPIFTDYTQEDGTVVTAAEQEIAYKSNKDAEQAKSVRASRETLLKETDWTQLDDTPFDNAKKMAWANYRQALRDIPLQAGFPWEVQWPVKPQ